MTHPKGWKRIRNMSEYLDSVSPLTHVAVFRKALDYYHHYLVVAVFTDTFEIVHYTGGKDARKLFSVVRITQQSLKFGDTDSDLLDFSAGVFFITKKNYPSDFDEKCVAYDRAQSRLGETEYSVSSNNCESFVTWVLTGEARSKQVDDSKSGKRVVMDSIDSALDHGTKLIKNGQMDLAFRLNATTMSHLGTKSAGTLAAAATAAKTGAEVVAKTAVARASAVTAGVTSGITAVAAVPIEATFCGLEVYKLHNQRKNNLISKKDFKRQVTKKVSGSASSVTVATGAGFLGAFIGQIVCPIPVFGGAVGGAIGGIIGSVVGRTSGTVVSGRIFDAVTD